MDIRALLDAFRGGFHLEEVSNGWSRRDILPSSKGCAEGSAAGEGSRREAMWSLCGMMSSR